jgi:hypothetical protein
MKNQRFVTVETYKKSYDKKSRLSRAGLDSFDMHVLKFHIYIYICGGSDTIGSARVHRAGVLHGVLRRGVLRKASVANPTALPSNGGGTPVPRG